MLFGPTGYLSSTPLLFLLLQAQELVLIKSKNAYFQSIFTMITIFEKGTCSKYYSNSIVWHLLTICNVAISHEIDLHTNIFPNPIVRKEFQLNNPNNQVDGCSSSLSEGLKSWLSPIKDLNPAPQIFFFNWIPFHNMECKWKTSTNPSHFWWTSDKYHWGVCLMEKSKKPQFKKRPLWALLWYHLEIKEF